MREYGPTPAEARGADTCRPIAFVHIQKTAGTSLKFVLRNSFGIRHCDVNPLDPGQTFLGTGDLAFARSVTPGLMSISSHEIVEPTRYLGNAVLPYTILRDPVSRMLSHFQHKVATGRHDGDFRRFLEDEDNHNFQVRKIAGDEDLDKARRLLREQYFFAGLAERFDASLRVLQALCPYPLDIRYRLRNVAGDNRLRAAIESDDRLMEAAEAANRLDRQLWTYVDETLFPGLVERSGVDVARPVSGFPRMRLAWRFHLGRLYHRLYYRKRLKRERRRLGLE